MGRNANKIIVKCAICGKKKEIIPSQKKNKNYCSRVCFIRSGKHRLFNPRLFKENY